DTDVDMAVLSDPDFPSRPQYMTNALFNETIMEFFIRPYPDNLSDWDDGNYRIVIPVYRFTTDLAAADSQNWFTFNAADYIVSKTTAEAFGMDWDYDSMTIWLQRADEKLKELKKHDKTARLAGVNELVPMWKGVRQPQVRD